MHGWKKTVDLSVFSGEVLTSVTATPYQCDLKFSDGKIFVTLECSWKLINKDSTSVSCNRAASDWLEKSDAIKRLVGNSVINAEPVLPGTLKIQFSSGSTLEAMDDSEKYESFQINFQDNFIVV